MKNNRIKLLVVLLMHFSKIGESQLLKQGSIVITHSPSNNICNVAPTSDPYPNLNPFVVSILDATNTSNIPDNTLSAGSLIKNKYVWTTGVGTKPNWKNSEGTNSWTVQNLGRVFGITLDDLGNIYVANSSIYSGEGSSGKHDKIWKIDGITGAMSAIWVSPLTSKTNRGLGNLKFFKYANSNFIVVSNWEDGKIYFIKESISGIWVNCGSFDPTFLLTNDNDKILPYGVAVSQKSNSLNLYYGELNMLANASKRVFSVQLNYSSGNIGVVTGENVEITSTPSSIPIPTNNGGQFIPVSDISFSSDYSKMVLAQQSLKVDLTITAHNSRVQEYEYVASWTPKGTFPSGFHSGVEPLSSPLINGLKEGNNSAGGVTYWNNILFKNGVSSNNLSCDTSILYSSDIIYIGPYNTGTPGTATFIPTSSEIIANFSNVTPTVYGILGLPSRNNFIGANQNLDAFNYSLKIDADDLFTNCDKYNLGDIEAFNEPSFCSQSCSCGSWENIMLGQNTWWNGPNYTVPALSYTSGQTNLSGVLFPNYHCIGGNDCTPAYTYKLIASNYTVFSLSGNNSLDLSQAQLKNLACGNYTITISAKCGNSDTTCGVVQIPLVVNCPPVCACKGEVTISNVNNVNISTQSTTAYANPVSNVSGNFILSSTTPVTEVRILVDEFRLSTTKGNDNCILCRNKPQTWASINTASLSGVINQTAINPAITKDMRETIFNNGSNTFFNLTGNTLNFSLGVPGITGLDCCTIKGEVCFKFIIRDVNCCEREVLKCFTFDLK